MRDSEKMKQELMGEEENLPLEKNDEFAMILAGFKAIGIPCIILILIIIIVTLLLFGGLF